jgi:hypothetical protein
VLDELNRMPEHHRFIRGLISWIGFRQVPLVYDRDPRFAGETHYPLLKMLRFASSKTWRMAMPWSSDACSCCAWTGCPTVFRSLPREERLHAVGRVPARILGPVDGLTKSMETVERAQRAGAAARKVITAPRRSPVPSDARRDAAASPATPARAASSTRRWSGHVLVPWRCR